MIPAAQWHAASGVAVPVWDRASQRAGQDGTTTECRPHAASNSAAPTTHQRHSGN
jgi:hypothetical protein